MEESKKDVDNQEPEDDTTETDQIQQEATILHTKTKSWLGFLGGTMQIVGKAIAEIARLKK